MKTWDRNSLILWRISYFQCALYLNMPFFMQASLGTTKYCSYFLKSMQCPKPDCMYLHELGDEAASFTKEEMQVMLLLPAFLLPYWHWQTCHLTLQAGKHQEYEQKLLQDLYKTNPNFLQSSTGEKTKGKSGTSQRFVLNHTFHTSSN